MKTFMSILLIVLNIFSFEKISDDLVSCITRSGYQEVQLERSAMGGFIAEITLDNKLNLRVIVDTGANKTLFDSTFMANNGYKLRHADLKLYTGSGEQIVKNTTVNNLKIGNANTGKAAVYCTDLTYIQKGMNYSGDDEIHGLLGSDFLTVYSALIDVKNSKMYLKVD